MAGSALHSVSHRTAIALLLMGLLGCATSSDAAPVAPSRSAAARGRVEHVVVLFQENVSFDHYFGTYPHATNPPGEPAFHARPGTPTVNGLSPTLLHHNPNRFNPQRLDRNEALTCDQDHSYANEQRAFDGGLMDKFVEHTDVEKCQAPAVGKKGLVMDYYDGNTVTALWNYAQSYALSDNFYDTIFGPSTPGAINLVSGQTHGATPANVKGIVANGTVIADRDPLFDDCSEKTPFLAMHGTNVGELLSRHNVTWGWFQGGFRATGRKNGKAVCGAARKNVGGVVIPDYKPHHEPFQYYKATANPHHLPPSSTAAIGTNADQANHQYDLKDFWTAVDAGRMPAVSFLKAAASEDGHAGCSDPIDEQRFLVNTINRLEKTPQWHSMVIVIAYDDSDGWYDHVMGPIVRHSNDPANDFLTGGACGKPNKGDYLDRCGYGPRLPLLVISPWARANFVDHRVTDQTSILRFIEDTWQLGRIGDQSYDALANSLAPMLDFTHRQPPLFLDPKTGEPVH